MTYVSVDASAVRDAVGGRVYVAGEGGYEAARLPWQRRLDPHPALIVEAANASDVRTALRFAREQDLPVAVQSTGHGAARIPDGGLLLKTNPMSAVTVDAGRRVARVGGGALWSDVIAAAAPHGLAPLSGSSPTVGVTGYTLGGGTGWLSRLYGFAADNVRRVELVTAEGELVTASAGEHPDLFWALRGGSGNFGVVTSLEFELFPVASVYAGVAMFDPGRAAEALAVYREWALDEPDESNTALVVAQLPPAPQLPEPVRGKRVLMLRAFYVGTAERGPARARAALRGGRHAAPGRHAGDELPRRGGHDAPAAAGDLRDAPRAVPRDPRRGDRRRRRGRTRRSCRHRVAALGRRDGAARRGRRPDRPSPRPLLGRRRRPGRDARGRGAHDGRRARPSSASCGRTRPAARC